MVGKIAPVLLVSGMVHAKSQAVCHLAVLGATNKVGLPGPPAKPQIATMASLVALVLRLVKELFTLRITSWTPVLVQLRLVVLLNKLSPVAVELARLTVSVELGQLGVLVPPSVELFSVAMAIALAHDLAQQPSLAAKYAATPVKLRPALSPLAQLLV